ncbi:MAG: bifunctional phosphoribosyl-AMP cyclohydrolase/phosphoribosyl-ATP diphosphatase, partial [Pseudomonadota bacterium]
MNESLDINNLDWNKADGLIPAIIQNSQTLEVLMLGFMNQPALELTLK